MEVRDDGTRYDAIVLLAHASDLASLLLKGGDPSLRHEECRSEQRRNQPALYFY